jgi:hypothetical protein
MDTDPAAAAGIVGWAFVVASPLWTLLVFAAYAIGRRQYSLKLLLALLAVEAVSVALAVVIFRSAATAKE